MSGRHGFGQTFDVGSGMAVLVAESAGVCTRPHVRTVTDRLTGATTSVPIPCGSTREAVCGPCATKARRLRMHQCREGWHRTDADTDGNEPSDALNDSDQDEQEDEELAGDPDTVDELAEERDEGGARRVRSTRRLDGVPDLPTVPMEDRTTGRAFTDPTTGGGVPAVDVPHPDPALLRQGDPRPRHPARPGPVRLPPGRPRRLVVAPAAGPVLAEPAPLRRYKVQYFSAIEAQRRLAPHLHAAVRGAIPRRVIKAVTRATYYAAWRPPLDRVVYDRDTGWPVWDQKTQTYVDPGTGEALPSWEEATEDLDEPAHVVRFGTQVDIKGLLGGTEDSDRTVRYLCKYLTKNVADTYADENADWSDAYQRHTDRLHAEVRRLPCSPGCANWLRHGVTPNDPGPGLVPGQCSSPANDRENLGLGGRRVWSLDNGPARP